MVNHLYLDDLPASVKFDGDIAVDTETKGLNIYNRDRLCVVQISDGKGDAHLVQFQDGDYSMATNLRKVLADDSRQKIFHFARFDIAALKIYLGIDMKNVFCTKISSKLVRTYTDRHGLKELCREICQVDLSKQQQCSDWSGKLNKKQIAYAASDVLYLNEIREHLIDRLNEENRMEIAQSCFDFLPTRVRLDIMGWENHDIFDHKSQ